METYTTERQTVRHESPPQNRKDLIIMSLMAIRDANSRNNIEEKIDAYKFFFENALPELQEKCDYDISRPYTLEPAIDDVKKEYLKVYPLLFEELIHRNMPYIINWQRKIHLDRLHREAVIVQGLLKKHTGWMFDKDNQLSAGK